MHRQRHAAYRDSRTPQHVHTVVVRTLSARAQSPTARRLHALTAQQKGGRRHARTTRSYTRVFHLARMQAPVTNTDGPLLCRVRCHRTAETNRLVTQKARASAILQAWLHPGSILERAQEKEEERRRPFTEDRQTGLASVLSRFVSPYLIILHPVFGKVDILEL